MAAGVRAGDVVVTVAHTFIATTEAISQAGALPEFVDIDERTYNMDADKLREYLEQKCSKDTAGKLVTGETFNSVRELKHILAHDHRVDFYRCLTEKLLTYALGRGTEYYDVETVDQIVQRLERENGRFSALLMGVIESAPFQGMRMQATAAASNDPTEKSGDTKRAALNPTKP